MVRFDVKICAACYHFGWRVLAGSLAHSLRVRVYAEFFFRGLLHVPRRGPFDLFLAVHGSMWAFLLCFWLCFLFFVRHMGCN
jgi:hypothetical protein